MNRKIEVTASLEVVPIELWTEEESMLITKAKEILESAHAPYSKFLVGAALLLENGSVFAANNQENVSFPVGICAERAVLSYVMGNYPRIKPLKIAIAAKRIGEDIYAYVTPCGICRQTINEYEMKFGSSIEILMLNGQEEILKAKGIEQLLPFRFNKFNS
ncbi:cytidine deaminase [Aquiflexum sp. TKW24L]|uniref:cytidine deaminase n=1 Tax=Aquiflexum sp. TKW24L TaxID=2942212 RepID=UPI00209853E6|nr:cytidine deaminase [Aquiflexum sp. TKW24L]MCL6257788.1 cytidine deaminase [Aquiflexum sp. TKW24L]